LESLTRPLSLSPEQIEELCETAEEAARKYVTSKVPSQKISDLNITVEAGGKEGVTVNVDVEVRLSPLLKEVDVERLAEGAVEAAFKSVEEFLRKIKCHSKK